MNLSFLFLCCLGSFPLVGCTRGVEVCQPGQRFVQAQHKNKCEDCPPSTYNDKRNHQMTQCFPCTPYNKRDHLKVLKAPCTRVKDTTIECVEHFFKVDDHKGNSVCRPCTNCTELGQFTGQPCSSYEDTICCKEKRMIIRDGKCVTLVFCTFDEYLEPRVIGKKETCKPCPEGLTNTDLFHRHLSCTRPKRTKRPAETQNPTTTDFCAPHLVIGNNSEELDSPIFYRKVGGTLTVKINVTGSPPPNRLSVFTVNTKRLITSRNLRRDTDVANDQNPYLLTYSSTTPPYGSVVVTFRSLTAENIEKLYRLEVSNGVGWPLKYTFFIRAEKATIDGDTVKMTKRGSGGSSMNTSVLALAIALLVACLLVYAVVIWIVYTARKGEMEGSKPKCRTGREDNDKRLFSKLAPPWQMDLLKMALHKIPSMNKDKLLEGTINSSNNSIRT